MRARHDIEIPTQRPIAGIHRIEPALAVAKIIDVHAEINQPGKNSRRRENLVAFFKETAIRAARPCIKLPEQLATGRIQRVHGHPSGDENPAASVKIGDRRRSGVREGCPRVRLEAVAPYELTITGS